MLFNREISWIHFNARVLHEAMDSRTPLLERVKFLQIFTTNLDEFFMKRVGGLKRQQEAGIQEGKYHQPGPSELLKEIRKQITPLLRQQASCWLNQIVPALNQNRIFTLEWNDLTPGEQGSIQSYFDQNLFPVLTPLSVDPGHPFPFISNLSSSLGLLLRNPRSSHSTESAYNTETLFARVKIPNTFPSWIRLSEDRLFSLRQIISQNIEKLFPGMEIIGTLPFRITRNADMERDEEDAEDLLEMVTEELRERRFAEIVRLEHGPNPNPILRDFLKTELQLEEEDIFETEVDVDFSNLSPIFDLPKRELKFRPWNPVIPKPLQDEETCIFNLIKESDILVHHPYESFHQSVERFVQAAVADSMVLAIKMTLYRTGADSPFIPLLIEAAESGKQVVCLVELKARFDEERNIQAAQSLEKAGVHVVYGIVGLKTHCKTTLVVRQEPDQVRSYIHIGTGNYHATTAKLYTDFGLFTCKSEFTDDIVQLFHFLTGRSLNRNYKKLIIAPLQMKQRFLELIRYEIGHVKEGRPARIIAKMNSLEDPDIIDALYEASREGVRIDLIVRGFCSLVPGVPGLSENIYVSSIIGRFLEHCRIFYFQNGAEQPLQGLFYMGSADWMSRNLTGRVEVVVPIEDLALKNRFYNFIQTLLSDRRQAWDLLSDGTYRQRQPSQEFPTEGSHETLMRLYESTLPVVIH